MMRLKLRRSDNEPISSGNDMLRDELERARLMRSEQRWEDVYRIVGEALSREPVLGEWLTFAMECRDQRHIGQAEKIFRLIVDKVPTYSPAYYEYAFLLRLQGRHRAAAGLLETALKHDWPRFRTQLFLAHMLFAQGAHAEGMAAIEATAAKSDHDRTAVAQMYAFGTYLNHNPLGRTLVLLDRIRARSKWLDSNQLAERIFQAVGQKRPFALIRFGDGEGGVLRLSGCDEAKHGSLYEHNRQELIAMWFGQSFPWRTNGFFELASELVAETSECDVIGVPYESWVEHEYRISSIRGVPSLTNVFHALLATPQNGREICSQLAHVELARSGNLAKIISQAGSISIISCLGGIGEMLKQRFGLADVAFYRIPGEQGSRSIIGETASDGVHFPDRFHQLMSELARPHNGRLFLIAGGLLGKLYAAQIRRHGGIAIDIGSIVDSWMGHATRPGYETPIAL